MAYLYGDSKESGLELNYIEFLRDFLDFGAQVMMSEHRIESLNEAGVKQRKEAEEELSRLRELSKKLDATLDSARSDEGKNATDRCIASVRSMATEAVKRAATEIKKEVSDTGQQNLGRIQRERSGNVKLLERLLLDHNLPDASGRVDIELAGTDKYGARLEGMSPLGLEWSFDIEIPAGHLFHKLVKISELDEHLEIQLPELSGLVRKSVRLRPQKLSNKVVTAVRHKKHQTVVELRIAAQADESGVDLLLTPGTQLVQVVRHHKGAESEKPFEPLDDDARKLAELVQRLSEATTDLASKRCALLDATFDGKPLKNHEDPAVLVRRIVDRIAPTIQEISRHSLSADELVLKSVLADDRREEIFAAKSDLLAKLRPVPVSHRGVFAPLGLGDLGDGVGDADPTREVVVSSTSAGNSAVVHTGVIGDVDEEEETAVVSDPPKPPSDQSKPVVAPPKAAPKEEAKPDAEAKKQSPDTIDVTLASLESEHTESDAS